MVALAAATIAVALWALGTDWGRERARAFIVAQVTAALEGRGTLSIGRMEGGLGGHFVADSLVLLDDRGAVIATISRVEADGALAGLLTGSLRLSRLLLVRPHVLLERKDSVWNLSRIFSSRGGATAARSALVITLDSAEVRDGRLDLVVPDTLPSLPAVRRTFRAIQLALGPTRVLSPGGGGGHTELRRLSTEISAPPVTLVRASGTVRWWTDSLALDLPEVRLPATHAGARGTIAWGARQAARLDLRVHADAIDLADIAWVSPLVPKHGDGSTDLHIRNATGRPDALEYVLTHLDLRATKSRLTGGFAVTPGKRVSVSGIAVELQPLDLDLVREIFGEGVPKRVWQGALTGAVRGRGGPLDAIRIDSAALTFDDRRAPGARSHVIVAGELDAQAKPSVLHGLLVQVQDLDVRTLGAVATLADSLHGVLKGSVTLDGPTNDIAFHALALTHVDGERPVSRISGSGRLASDQATRWLDATLSLDTIAVATLARDRTTIPLRGGMRGDLELHATRDTMTIDALLRAGGGTVSFHGLTLLDSARTWVRGHASLHALDPRVLVARADIPVLWLDGTADLEVDGTAGRTEGHVDLSLDTTSVVGASRLLLGQVRAGVDSAGFHVDTAELRAADWRASARGRLAKTGITHDTLRFAVAFDSLAPLRALLLDTAGTAVADSLHGAIGAEGLLVGSLDTIALSAKFSGRDLRWNGVAIHLATGSAELTGLPTTPGGIVTFTADGVSASGYTASRVQARVDLRDGREARVSAEAASGDSLRVRFAGLARRSADTTRVALDSLMFALGASRWQLDRPSRLEITSHRIVLDSTLLRSARNATIALRAVLPDSGAVDGAFHVRALGREEVAFTALLSPDLDGRANADVRMSGTRDAPRLSFVASLDSVTVAEKAAPSLAATGAYYGRRAQVDLHGTLGDRELLAVSADLPLDLSLRSVAKRLPDDSIFVRVHADSVPLTGFEALLPAAEALGGTLWADDTVRGTWARKTWAGFVRVRDGAFDLPRIGLAGRELATRLALRGDSVIIVEPLRMVDADSPRDYITATGALVHTQAGWLADLRSESRDFKLFDDPHLATVDATWNVHLTGFLRQPFLEGDVTLPSATFMIGQVRQVRPVHLAAGEETTPPIGMPIIKSLHVTLGNDVRLKSRDANVGLAGELDIAGELSNPYAAGVVFADRGTYRVDLGVLKRTFRVDSGTVRVAGTRQMPASLDIWTSYVVRSAEHDDRTIVAHLTGASDAPRLTLSSNEAGTAVAQSEIISYLLFGSPTFGIAGTQQATSTASAAIAPTLGGVLEGVLGPMLPFFSSLQVTQVAGNEQQNLFTNPIDALFSSFGLTAGRQVGSDSFLNLSGGVCRGSRVSSTQSAAGWFGIAAEYRPKRGPGGVVSIDPGSSPCNRVGRFADIYQFGFDLFKSWSF